MSMRDDRSFDEEAFDSPPRKPLIEQYRADGAAPPFRRYAKSAAVLGRAAEKIAADCLRQSGFSILAANYTLPAVGEIDLIANRGNCLYAVEVKARHQGRTDETASAEQSIDRGKRARLRFCLAKFSREHHLLQYEMRFIAIVLYFDSLNRLCEAAAIEM